MAHGLKLHKYLPAFREIAQNPGIDREELAKRLEIDRGGLEHALEAYFGSARFCTAAAIATVQAQGVAPLPSASLDRGRWANRTLMPQSYSRYCPVLRSIISSGESKTIARIESLGASVDAWRSFKAKWFGGGEITPDRARAFIAFGEKAVQEVSVGA